MTEHRLSEIREPARGVPVRLDAIDACTYGWIKGLTDEEGLQLGKGVEVFRLLALDYAELVGMGYPRASRRQTALLLGTHGKLACAYESALGIGYDVGNMVIAELAWKTRDPRFYDAPGWEHGWRQEISVAVAIIEGIEQLLTATWIADGCPKGKQELGFPPVFLEGGLHMVSRVISEVARALGYPVFALENSWLPGHYLIAPDSGACVDRWGAGYDRARGRACANDALERTKAFVDEQLAQKHDLSWYRKAYPWKFANRSADTELPQAWLQDVVHQAEKKEKIVILHLGQVPYDASVTMDGENMDEMRVMVDVAQTFDPKHVAYVYRPHPMEEPSRITGETSSTRISAFAEAWPWWAFHVVDSERTPFSAHYPEDPTSPSPVVRVVTINSQAGLELARWFPVRTYGRAFYDLAGVTQKSIYMPVSNPVYRETRWLTYVRWLLEKHYFKIPESPRPAEELLDYAAEVRSAGFHFFDPSREF